MEGDSIFGKWAKKICANLKTKTCGEIDEFELKKSGAGIQNFAYIAWIKKLLILFMHLWGLKFELFVSA